MLHFHKWKYVYKPIQDTFEGVKYTKYYSKYRICKKCRKAQTLERGLRDIYWDNLSKQETAILKTLIRDMGKYYMILNQEE